MARKRAPVVARRLQNGGSIEGKVALVTGGSRGIGLAIAEALVGAGAFVFVTGRDRKALKSASAQLGKSATAVRCDLRDPRAVASLCREIKKRFGRLDFLVNNAGIAHPLANVDKLTLETWREVIDINLTGLFLVTHHALPLISSGGVIVNNLSISAKQVFAGFSAYSASKFGALGFTDALRLEVRERGIRVTALLPGAVRTDIWQQFWPDAPKAKMVSPGSVAEMVLQILQLPENATVEQLQIGPASGTL
jgi:NAD(P)-dependent dehydrogenase (short-subunit alcohol dehydrogenase family)